MTVSKQKILIVDDDSNIADLISLYLIKECYDTKIVGDGEAALEAFSTWGFFRGLFLSVRRVLHCNPFCRAGYDPVPQKKEKQPAGR